MMIIYIATISNLLRNIVNIAVKRISRGTKCRTQTHNNREAIFVWVAPVAAKRLSSGARLYIYMLQSKCVFSQKAF